MRYQVPFFTYDFNKDKIDENLFRYLKESSKQKILEDFNAFKSKTKSEFYAQYKTEKTIRDVTFAVAGISTLGAFIFWDTHRDIAVVCIMMIFPVFFALIYVQSFGLSAQELRKALIRRKKNLIRIHKIAQKSDSFRHFIGGIQV